MNPDEVEPNENGNVCNQPVAPKPRKKREMTPELLEKLKLARERAAELRNMAKETKSKLPSNIPEKEKTKVAQYLATRKAIKEQIKQDLIEEIEKTEEPEPEYQLPQKSTEPPPPIPKPSKKVVKNVQPEPESDSDDEYTTIKVPKKKIIKWKKREEQLKPAEPEKPKRPQFNPYGTQHLIGLAMNGYSF
jgi:hypothetical protein